MSASPGAIKRLQLEMRMLRTAPPEGIQARPDDDNILLWHYVLTGPPDTPYAGGTYLGRLRFPPDYPFAPPSILITTPNGRFKTDSRLCLSMSDFHPKDWNPVWNVGTILTGMLSFMVTNDATYGSIEATAERRAAMARASHRFNATFPTFRSAFPDLVEAEERLASAVEADEAAKTGGAGSAANAAISGGAGAGAGRGAVSVVRQVLRRATVAAMQALLLGLGVAFVLFVLA